MRSQALQDVLVQVVAASRVESTWAGHEEALQLFTRFCGAQGLVPFPSDTSSLLLFASYMIGPKQRAVATVVKLVQSIGTLHTLMGATNPVGPTTCWPFFREGLLRAAAAERSDLQSQRVVHAPISLALIREACRNMEGSLKSPALSSLQRFCILRNRAAFLLGIRLCLRAAELRSLTTLGVRFSDDCQEMSVYVRLRKTDKTATTAQRFIVTRGASVYTCPVRAMWHYLNDKDGRPWAEARLDPEAQLAKASGASQLDFFGLFLQAKRSRGRQYLGALQGFSSVVSAVLEHARVPAETLREFAAHSLRVTGVTLLANAGLDADVVKAIAGFVPNTRMLATYVRSNELHRGCPPAAIGDVTPVPVLLQREATDALIRSGVAPRRPPPTPARDRRGGPRRKKAGSGRRRPAAAQRDAADSPSPAESDSEEEKIVEEDELAARAVSQALSLEGGRRAPHLLTIAMGL